MEVAPPTEENCVVAELVRPWLNPRTKPMPQHNGMPAFLPAELSVEYFVGEKVLRACYVPGYGTAGKGYYSLDTRDAYRILSKQIRIRMRRLERTSNRSSFSCLMQCIRKQSAEQRRDEKQLQKKMDAMYNLEKRMSHRPQHSRNPHESAMPTMIQEYTPHTNQEQIFYSGDAPPPVVTGKGNAGFLSAAAGGCCM
jgi:hypothetical protein